MSADSRTGIVAILFTDIESSSRLWEQDSDRMSLALEKHDALGRTAVEHHRGTVVKMTGDGMYATFDDPVDALGATVALQKALADPIATNGIALRVRCGLHAGVVERRGHEVSGVPVNRAARIMAAAHGEQILLSQAMVELVRGRLPSDVALIDLGLVRLRDLANPEHIHQLAHQGLRQDFPALRTLEFTPNNLPQQATSFIGRERELAQANTLLERTRLLSLLGVGGIGKTRLALQLAADTLEDYPDGVWFVELAALADSRLVPQAVASALAVREEAGRPVLEALVKHVKDRQMLLVLDNCEHLIDACADLARHLLQCAPALKILATSREALRLTGELSYQVPALTVPAPSTAPAIDALTQYEAVRLFVDRASAVEPAFQVTDRNAAAVTDICRRLDGIPLALELAAARVRTMSVQKIDEHLSDRFRLLTGGDRTALPRQQTLRALIDWSYKLLPAPERTLLGRLAVFAGGWTLEAAEAVGAGGVIAGADVLDLQSRLVEKSLVALEQGERYGLLETIRHYARERLIESGEEDEVRTRHLRFCLALAEEETYGVEQARWFRRLDLELENVLSAHAWCDRAPEGGTLGLRLVYRLRGYWVHRGLLGLGLQLTRDALGRQGTQARNLARAQALSGAGYISSLMGRYAEARTYLEESVTIARELGDSFLAAWSLVHLTDVLVSCGDLAPARIHAEQALALARGLGDLIVLSLSLSAMGEVCSAEGNSEGAEKCYEEALACDRRRGGKGSAAGVLASLAIIAIQRGAGDRARSLLREGLAMADEIGSKWRGCGLLELCPALAVRTQEFERAARFLGAAEAQSAQIGLADATLDEFAPLIGRARETLGAAAFETAEAAGRALTYEQAIAEARAWLDQAS